MGCITEMATGNCRAMAVKRETYERYNSELDAELHNFVWSHPRVRYWYKNANGRIIINSPWRLIDYWRLTLRPNIDDYDLVS